MPIRKKIDELVEQLQKAKEEEIAAIERLRAYLKSHPIEVAQLQNLTREMMEHCERSTLLWRRLHDTAVAEE